MDMLPINETISWKKRLQFIQITLFFNHSGLTESIVPKNLFWDNKVDNKILGQLRDHYHNFLMTDFLLGFHGRWVRRNDRPSACPRRFASVALNVSRPGKHEWSSLFLGSGWITCVRRWVFRACWNDSPGIHVDSSPTLLNNPNCSELGVVISEPNAGAYFVPIK